MQQRFTDKELAHLANNGYGGEIVGEKTTHELLTHPWIVHAVGEFGSNLMNKSATLGGFDQDSDVSLSFKELLNISSDWKQVNHIPGDGGAPSGNALSVEF